MKARPWDVATGVAGVALLVSLFLAWFDAQEVVAVSAWEAFSVTDVVLALAALGGLALFAAQATSRSPAVATAVTVVVSAFAVPATLLAAYRLLNPPGPNDLVGLEPGAYLGLLATLALTVAAWRAMRDESPRASEHHVAVQDFPAPPATAAGPREPA